MALATRPKPKTHHKKRQALHHRRTKDYTKHYWPYIPVISLVGTAALLSVRHTQQTAGSALSTQPTTTGSLLGVADTTLIGICLGLAVVIYVALRITRKR